ncbi:hypothetical protein FOCC_FOCC010941 [Frankliniella occidentalis]|nr:hypothetical protein FOCC_FOCC010941 [Frankliniella occidentalis]
MDVIALLNTAIWLLERALEQEEEDEMVAALVIGRTGARIVAWMEEGIDLLGDDDEENWVKINVDIDGLRSMGAPSFARHFRVLNATFEILLETLANSMIDNGKVLRIRKRLDIPLLMVLWVLANSDAFRGIALHFGEVGSMHDARVFRRNRSPLQRKLLENENNKLLDADPHIIGDKACPLMDCLMIPFKTRVKI